MSEIYEQAAAAARELVAAASLTVGELMIVGCSTSEVLGQAIGSASAPDTAAELFSGIYDVLHPLGIYLAAQCCEHLNRAVIVEHEYATAHNLPIVNVVPQPKAGGSFATCAYRAFERSAAVESVKADAGIDIGGTLIGMHLKSVAVPTRLSIKKIGEAAIICARVRPKFIGGSRAVYNEDLM